MASASGTLIESVALSDMPNQNFAAALQYWIDAKKDRVLPPPEAIAPSRLPRVLISSLTVLAVEDGPKRLRFRLFGTKLVDATGFDLTGKFGEDVIGAEETNARHYAAIEAKRPYLFNGPLTWSSRDYKGYTALVMPFGDEAGKVTRFLDYTEFERRRV